MAYQSEAELEMQFIEQLNNQGYSTVSIPDYDALLDNFKVQFAEFNKDKIDKSFSAKEWERIFNIIDGKSVFQSAKILRDKFVLERDDGTKTYLSFFDQDASKNIFQVTHQNDRGRKVCKSLRCYAARKWTSSDTGRVETARSRYSRSDQPGDAI